MRIVAKTIKGKEFLYSVRSAHEVSKRSGQIIADELNRIRYQLKHGEVWHVYDTDEYSAGFAFAVNQKFKIRNGKLMEVR